MAIGRPKEFDREQIALDLMEWAKRPDSINLNKFCCTYEPMIPPSYITLWARESKEFSLAYESAKACLGARREEMLTMETLHVKAYDLNAKTYDYFLNEQAQKTAIFESALKKDEAGVPHTNVNVVVPHDLAIGSNIPASTISNKHPEGSQ